jgi:hypothetical protein
VTRQAEHTPPPPRLLIRFAKRKDGRYVLSCVRRDGSVTWQRNDGGHAAFFPVHDLTHYAVETELRHRLGFFGLLAVGWDFTDFAENWGRRPMPADADPSELIVGLLDAERVGGTSASAAELNESAALFYAQRGVTDAGGQTVRLTDEQLAWIRRRLRGLVEQWEALAPGGTMELPFEID